MNFDRPDVIENSRKAHLVGDFQEFITGRRHAVSEEPRAAVKNMVGSNQHNNPRQQQQQGMIQLIIINCLTNASGSCMRRFHARHAGDAIRIRLRANGR